MKKHYYILLFAFHLPFLLNAQLKINELMSNNVSAVMDESWNYSMWVELYNSGSTTQNQSNYYFTDDMSQPKKWQPAQGTIAAGGYRVFYFERHDRTGHAGFKLDPEGGVLYLTNSSGEIVDQVEYPAQYRNASYGRVQDGGAEWVFFSEFSPGASNNDKKWSYRQCDKPEFETKGGFYSGTISVKFVTPKVNETIYYTLNGEEPTVNSYVYTPGAGITVSATTNIRACAFSDEKLPSMVSSATFFINQRQIDLPVVSLITAPKNLTDNTIGIYVKGTNGAIWREGETELYNWYQDWDRPTNFEFFDKNKENHLNQELDIAISGGWTRQHAVKSLKIQPRKKFGDNRLRYDFFAATKPNQKYKDIQIRNSGNDFGYSMMRDGFMQSLVFGRMNVDGQAYEPAVCFINTAYKGIMNLRERTSKDYLYSNYGLDEDDFYLFEQSETYALPFKTLTSYVENNDVTNAQVYAQIGEMMDLDNFMDYFIAEIFYANTDWPYGNLKVWKEKENGKWRWILFDTDFGFSLYGDNYSNNTLDLALTATDKLNNHARVPSSIIFSRLMTNSTFKNKFIDRFCIHLSSTFETNRVNLIMDSIAARIQNEMVYHRSIFGGNLGNEINKMKNFSANRPTRMLGFISNKYCNSSVVQTINISSNIDRAKYLFNTEAIIDNSIALKSFKNRTVSIEPQNIVGYVFKHWLIESAVNSQTLVPMGSEWKYWDKNGMPAANWYTNAYADNSWSQGPAQLGYGDRFPNVSTTLDYGGNANNKYMTAYFRKAVTITNLADKDDFELKVYVDDGVCVYVNGTEVGRYNLAAGTLAFETAAITYNNGEEVTFTVPKNLLVEGVNLIAAEVHQDKPTSSDLVFDLQLSCSSGNESGQIYQERVYTTTLASDIRIKAIFEETEIIDPNENADIRINEIVASNLSVQDEYGEYDDYIELYNNGDEDVNVAGWYLTDTPSHLTLSRIPTTDSAKTLIPAKGRIIIWADEQPKQGVLHVDFKLGKDGETIILSRKDPLEQIIIVDEVTYPALGNDQSYSRYPDGADNWVRQAPTFNRSNTDLSSALAQIQVEPGIFPRLVSTHFIVTDAVAQEIRIVDITGKTLLQTMCTSDYETVQVKDIPKGIYLVLINDQAFKIVKTHI